MTSEHPIFTITVMTIEWRTRSKESNEADMMVCNETRCMGFYHTLAEALEAVEENRGSMNECLYSYLVIEEYGPGIQTLSESEHWFEWDWDKNYWFHCNKPKDFFTCCYAMG